MLSLVIDSDRSEPGPTQMDFLGDDIQPLGAAATQIFTQ